MKHEGETFNNGDEVILDGNEFVDCHFLDCKWVIEGKSMPSISGGSVTNIRALAPREHALITLNTLSLLYRQGGIYRQMAERCISFIKGESDVIELDQTH